MIIDSCNPCKCLGGHIDNEMFRSTVVALLCKLAGEGTSGVFYDFEILCDASTDEPKIVRYRYTHGSTEVTAEAFNLDGTPYSGDIDALVHCSAKDSEIEILTDYHSGTATQFLRTYLKAPDGSLVSVRDTTLDGQTAYTPVGVVSYQVVVSNMPSVPIPSSVVPMLDTYTDNGVEYEVQFLRVFFKNQSGGIISKSDVQLDGTTSYTVQGTVSLGHGVLLVE